MVEPNEQLSTLERQDAFLDHWASGEGVDFPKAENRDAFQERAQMVAQAIRIDSNAKRIPIMPLATFAPTHLKGYTGYQAMYDPNIAGQSHLDYCKEYRPDTAPAVPMVMYGPALETLQYRLYKWPGHGVSEESSYQFDEKEYMKPEEYDHLIADPTDFWLRSWLPKTHGALGPLANTLPVYGSMELSILGSWLTSLGSPKSQEALSDLMKAGKQCFDWMTTLGQYMNKMNAEGFPFCAGGATKAPFDVLSDSFRGTTAMMMDLYRRPNKVLKAVERLIYPMITNGIRNAQNSGNPLVFMPLHKGSDGFLSDEQFKEFYWPSLKAVMYGLADAGCVPVCFVEGSYNQRLEYLAETSDIRCMYIFDRTDMNKACDLLGGKVCIGGGFPVSQILTGKPEQVKEETQNLINIAARKKGYVLSVGCAMDEAKSDTLKAFTEAGKQFGHY